jgi:membrane protein YqaA with SNARE-associated domain
MFRKLYDWMLKLAASPRAPAALGVISFSESSFFPIPPDVMLAPMVLAEPKKAWRYATICTAASVLGALLGYAIGALLYDSVGKWIIDFYGYQGGVEAFRAAYAEHGHWIILLKGLTPIPFKLVTITSGFAGYDIVMFVVLSLITRGVRFFAVAGLLNRFSGPIKHLLDRHLTLIAIVIILGVIGGVFAAKWLF